MSVGTLFGITKEQLVAYCLTQEFPGSLKWPSNHPIWDGYVGDLPSPKEAWKDKRYLTKAVDNLYWILDKYIKENREQRFVERHQRYFESCQLVNNKIIFSDIQLLRAVLARFTIAKIAPKVTAISENDVYRIIQESNIDISSGVYAPMAGFGGIVKGSIKWFEEHNVPITDNLIEAYDINENLCQYYGWSWKDMLFEKTTTNKTVIVCPPFGVEYEHWLGTPKEMSDIPFLEWYFLVKDFITAPNYIIIGPEVKIKNCNKDKIGLFRKSSGVQLWTDSVYNQCVKK